MTRNENRTRGLGAPGTVETEAAKKILRSRNEIRKWIAERMAALARLGILR